MGGVSDHDPSAYYHVEAEPVRTTHASPPPAIDWASKSADEILADVGALVDSINRAQAAYLADVPHPVHPTERARMVSALYGIRRTRSGLWTVAGRRYRTRRLAVEAVTDWCATAMTRAAVRYREFAGCINGVEIRGSIVV